MPRPGERSEYCRRQAEDCAARATVTILPEIEDAYRQLEHGWLQLVAEFDPVPSSALQSGTADAGQPPAVEQPQPEAKPGRGKPAGSKAG
jgi:hypothetical protein